MKSVLILALGAAVATAGAASAGDRGGGSHSSRGYGGGYSAANVNVNVNAQASAYARVSVRAHEVSRIQTARNVVVIDNSQADYAPVYGGGLPFAALGAVAMVSGPSAPFGYAVSGMGRDYVQSSGRYRQVAAVSDDRGGRYGYSSAVRVEGERWGGSGNNGAVYDRNCECNVPTVNVPFYTVRPPAPPIRVRAPGMRVSSAPVFAPSPAIYIQGPPIYVDAPPVNVAPAQVYLEAPDVHVRPSEVTVAPPEIHFTPAAPDHPDEHCCDVASPPSATLNLPPPSDVDHPNYLAPGYEAVPVNGSGYAQEPGERG